jgi:plasmid stabilization system protein ParE
MSLISTRLPLRALVTRYDYIIRYRVAGDIVYVLRVRHTARRPTDP